ncbi:hypothetical protein SAMN06264855_10762 [Halorubrum vacuolatum]|uniref:Uncharacterized protein n=1 Tax=Halorubrum vacuolatum TaxID=63740 RepID=A0A238WEF8_HALVU|nr:hypothetical protein SAMN06264855_10762 [Halorubrum vacuolatum]
MAGTHHSDDTRRRGPRGPAFPSTAGRRLRRFLTVTVVIGFAILLAAATLAPVVAAENVSVTLDDGDDVAGAGTTETHNFTVDAAELNGSTTVTLDFGEAFDGDGSGSIDDVEAVSATGDEHNASTLASSDGNVTVEVDPATGDGNVSLTIPVEVTHPSAGDEHAIDVTVEDGDGTRTAETTLITHELSVTVGDDEVAADGDDANTTLTIESVGSDVDSTPAIVSTRNDALSERALFRVLTGGADPAEMEDVNKSELQDKPSAGSVDDLNWTFGPDDELGVMGYADESDSVVVFSNESTAGGTITFDVSAVDPPNAYDFDVETVETEATATETVTVAEVDRSGSFSADRYEAPAGELVEFSVSLDGADEGYVVLGGDRLSDPDVPTGYLDVLHVEDGATIEANTRLIGTDASSEDVYGDDGVVSYAQEYGPDVDADDTDTFDGLRFEDADGDSVGRSLTDFRGAAASGGIVGPLTPQRYRLTLGTGDAITVRSDDIVAPEHSLDRSHLVLTEPEFGETVSIATAPGGPAGADAAEDDPLSDAINRSQITEGDRLVIEFEATGFGGALTQLAEEHPDHEDGREAVHEDGELRADVFNDLLEAEEGLSLSVTQTNPGRNEPRSRLDLSSVSSGDAFLFVEEPDGGASGDASAIGTYTLVIDTRGNAFDRTPSAGEEFEVELAVEGDSDERYKFDSSDGSPPGPFAAQSATDDDVDQQFPYFGPKDAGSTATATMPADSMAVMTSSVAAGRAVPAAPEAVSTTSTAWTSGTTASRTTRVAPTPTSWRNVSTTSKRRSPRFPRRFRPFAPKTRRSPGRSRTSRRTSETSSTSTRW